MLLLRSAITLPCWLLCAHVRTGCSCNASVVPYCGQCCPKNYTEQFYFENPARYSSHPPTLLAQTSTEDDHADLCATSNYYDTLRSHGVHAELYLVPKEDMRCQCIGTPGNPAAAGSPFSSHCTDSWTVCESMESTNCCISHTLGFADMVVPTVKFVLNVTS